jgi:hypothetical protein
MACFWGRPSLTILLMFLDTAFFEDPLERGMISYTSND